MRAWTEEELGLEEWDLAIEAQKLADKRLSELVKKLAEMNDIPEGSHRYERLQEQTYDSILSINYEDEEEIDHE